MPLHTHQGNFLYSEIDLLDYLLFFEVPYSDEYIWRILNLLNAALKRLYFLNEGCDNAVQILVCDITLFHNLFYESIVRHKHFGC